jgi:hypothetical protein
MLTILKGACYVICRTCERYAPLSAEREDLDRPADPCPFVCSRCGARAEIVMDVPRGFVLTEPASRERKRLVRTDPPGRSGPRHTPNF